MTFNDIVDELRNQHHNHPSLEDQILILTIHQWVGTGPDGRHLTKRQLSDILEDIGIELTYNIDTVHKNLDNAGYLESFQRANDPDWWIIRQRDEEIVLGKLPSAVDDECARALSHIQSMDPPEEKEEPLLTDGWGEETELNEDGQTLREEIVEEVGADIEPEQLEEHLQTGEEDVRMEKLNEVVNTVRESDTFDKPDSYDEINFIPKANRYHLSEGVVERVG